MKRIYVYPRATKRFIQSIQYGGLASGLIIFWLGITFPTQIKNWSSVFVRNFLIKDQQINKENNWGPYSDALAKNFTKIYHK